MNLESMAFLGYYLVNGFAFPVVKGEVVKVTDEIVKEIDS